ncbi:MAG: transglycosylase SLT domain-containing protein [Gemmatimonadetes bacterium]|nr:transglycosylase SLT domain-containing protein [Gemmatimonadota bacterium]
MKRAHKALALIAVAAAACGPATVTQVPTPASAAPEVVQAPAPVQPEVADSLAVLASGSEIAAGDTAQEEADSAADQAALSALDELELESLDKNAGQVRSVMVPAVSGAEVAGEASGMFAAPRGGTASVASPTYDIDVETFASHGRVQAYMDYFLGPARDRFGIWLGRMARYEGMARNRFREQGIPEDMVYLGLIESGFSTGAVSWAKAVGMWQFMAGTGRLYGLTVDQWVDERRDPFKATDAAARLLSDLNAEFGSWYLAAAAYNAGSGRVSRGLRRLAKSDADSLVDNMFFRLSDKRYLKRETRDYVPKLIAAALIAKEPARYGFDSLPILHPLVYDEVSVGAQTGLDVIARLSDTTTAALLELNPQYFRGVTPPKAVIVRVPRGTGTSVAQRWAGLPANERVTVIDHRIARGETISQIAKRYRVDASLIMAANPRLKPRALRVGARITIPVSPVARAKLAASRPRPRQVPKAKTVATASGRWHVVRYGESLWVIAQRYRVRISDLRVWNDLTAKEVLKPGTRLLVARPAAGAADIPAESSLP